MSSEEPRPLPKPDEHGYRLLVGHKRTDGTFKSSRELRMQYLQYTDRLIYEITHGVTMTRPDGSTAADVVPDVVIFMDKSARPVQWLIAGAWDRLSPMQVGAHPAPRPEFAFLNIDRMHWITDVDPQGNGLLQMDRIPTGTIRSLRSVFVDPQYKRAGLDESIDVAPSDLDGRNILTVDEVFSTGRTAEMAGAMLRRAFPTSSVGATHWMRGVAAVGAARGNLDLPVWYDESTELGRGVGDRMTGGGTDRVSDNITQQLGRWFLSTRLRMPDPRGDQLREEIRRLTSQPDVPIRVASEREDAVERMEWLNDGRPIAEVMAEIQSILPHRLGR